MKKTPDTQNHNLLVSIDRKMDILSNKVHRIELSQTRMESDIEHHIKRTDALEKHVKVIENQVKPWEALTVTWTGVAKFIATLSALAAIIALFLSKS